MHYEKIVIRRLIIITTLILTLLVYTALKLIHPVTAKESGTSNKKTILIDPGHGGYDGGADGQTGAKEKDLNLSISLKLRDELKQQGFNVIMIREEDKALLDEGKRTGTKKAQDIANRCKIKEESKADIFISIHQNKFPQGKYFGSQVWYSNSEKSRRLAHIVQEKLRLELDSRNNRVEKPAKNDIRILSCNDTMPSVLVECGFLSNYEEEKLLNDEKYQQKIATILAKAIKDYMKED